ncbi:MAG: hypothetical protein ACK5MT_05165 [Actinomycetales bacterium]
MTVRTAEAVRPNGPDSDGADKDVLAVGPGTSRAWLESMRREGLLVAVGDCYLVGDVADRPAARRRALAAAVPDGVVIGLSTAVWALGGPPTDPSPRPRSASALVAAGSRAIPVHIFSPGARVCPQLRVHVARVPAQDTVQVDGLTLTTATRTLVDLALTGEAHDDEALRWLLTRAGVSPVEAMSALAERGRVRRRDHALQVLRLVYAGVTNPIATASLSGQSAATQQVPADSPPPD